MLTPCTEPGCSELVKRGKCDTHRKEHRRKAYRTRPTAGGPPSPYSTTAWQRTRRKQLRDAPICGHCGAPANVVDHEPPRRQLLDAGVANPDDQAFLQSLCESCHNRKTATSDGGFGRPPRPIDDR